MLISTSITRSKGRYTQSFEPPLSLYVKQAIGAAQAANFDLSNACAGMLTGVFILQDLVARGEINCGMVVSGEYISHLSWNAARQIRSLFSKQLASLTLGDAGAAVIVERAPSGCGIDVIGFTSGLVWQERHGRRVPRQAAGQHEMVIEGKPGYAARLADCAEEASRRFLRRLGMSWDEIDLVVPAPSSPDFLDALVGRLGVPGDRVAYITEDLEGCLHHRAHRRPASIHQIWPAW